MTVDDVLDILGLPLLGVVPDDENVVIATNQGEPLVGKILTPDRLSSISAGVWREKKFLLRILERM